MRKYSYDDLATLRINPYHKGCHCYYFIWGDISKGWKRLNEKEIEGLKFIKYKTLIKECCVNINERRRIKYLQNHRDI